MAQRDLTRARIQIARAAQSLRTAVDALEIAVVALADDDARELRKKPTKRAAKKARR